MPHLVPTCFLLLAFSLNSPLAFILYFYPNHHFCPSSPPASQTKLRIPCCPLSSKNQCKRFPATSRPLPPLCLSPSFFLRHYLYSFLYQLSHPNRATPLPQNRKPTKTKRQKAQNPPPISFFFPSQSHSQPFFAPQIYRAHLRPASPTLPLLAPS